MLRPAAAALLLVVVVGCSDKTSVTAPTRPIPQASRSSFSISAATWSPATPMLSAVAQTTYGVINGKLYAAGGVRSDVACCVYGGQTEVFDPNTSTWSSLAPMPIPVGFQGGNASAVVNGKLYAMGGCLTTSPGGVSAARSYDPSTNTWSTVAPMLESRCLHNVVAANGKVYVFGGSPGGGVSGPGPNDLNVYVYNPATDGWTTTTPMLQTHWDAGAAVVGNTIYLVGGQHAGGGQCLTTVEAFDLTTQVWSTRASLPAARCYARATTLNGMVYVVTGTTFGGCCVTEVDVYDPSTDKWGTGPQLPVQRTESILGVINGTLYVAGGENTTNQQLYSDMYALSSIAAPTITPTVSGTVGSNGWYTSDVSVTWTVDAHGGTVSSSTGCGATTLTTDTGAATYSCTATTAGGTSTQSVTVKRDATPPVVHYSGNAGTYTVDQTISITCTATDPIPGSGVTSSTCANISAAAYTLALGAHTYSATATDAAGNVGSGSTSFTIQSTPGSLSTVTSLVVTNTGVASALVSKLAAAAHSIAAGNTNAARGQIQAYVHLVQAQTGKSISATNAAMLIRLAQALLP